MSDSNVAIRLKLFIEHKNLSYSQFADECKIPRPSLSQLLTGRNKKISDILVGQIHSAFPDLNILWLLFGEGQMLGTTLISNGAKSGNAVSNDLRPSISTDYGSLQTDTISSEGKSTPDNPNSSSEPNIFATSSSQNSNFSKEIPLSQAEIEAKHTENELVEANLKIRSLQAQIEKMKRNPRRVTQIMVYYDDSTFETFVPGNPSR